MTLKCEACKLLEDRVKTMESNMTNINELVDLLNDVKSTIKIFVICGKGVKWLAVTVGTISGVYYTVKHFLSTI